ncbi:hypothetical protein [Spiroplasma sp. AdecLV25b]|uniref:hypothetical protein n=1 Tax=Spiroplasma sp. AdecLV25b TaxID=3027162 RepID=UPI0027DF4B2A|nr:hypothetical protein [Spiroplasma sp. AdecLV25b]
MKKKKVLIISGSVIITIISIILIVFFSIYNYNNEIYNRDYYVSMLNDNYWRITHDKQYYNFVKNYEEKITEPASEQSKQDFDNLYLKNDPVKGWENYSSLEHDLTTNRLSSYVTINVNWTKLLNQTGLSDEKINEFKQKMLHIYNIIANLYGKDNILKLLQEVIMEEQTGRTIAFVWPKRRKVNNTEVNMQNMYVGPKFGLSLRLCVNLKK